jgi:hypothetical protein
MGFIAGTNSSATGGLEACQRLEVLLMNRHAAVKN